MKKKRSSKTGEVFRFLLGISLCICTAAFSDTIKQAVSKAIGLCLGTLVPSLFPMLFVSSMLSFVNSPNLLIKVSDLPMRKLFGLHGHCTLPMLLSFTQGFPIAVRTALSGFKNTKLTLEEARTIAVFFTSPGLSFCSVVAGQSIFGSVYVGYSLLFSCIFSDVLLCFLFHRRSKTENCKEKTDHTEKLSVSETFIRSCAEASSAIIGICSWVLLFSAFSAVLKLILPFRSLSPVLSVIPEVTDAVIYAGQKKDLPLAAFSLSFGGLCVFCQLLPGIKQLGINPAYFLALRLVSGIISGLTEKLLITVFPFTVPTAAAAKILPTSGSVSGSFSLMVLCAVFMLSLNNGQKKKRINY